MDAIVVPTRDIILIAASRFFDPDSDGVRAARDRIEPPSYPTENERPQPLIYPVEACIILRGALKVSPPYEAMPAQRISAQQFAGHWIALEREEFANVRRDRQKQFLRRVLERAFAQVEVDPETAEEIENITDTVRREFSKTIPKERRLGRAFWTDTGSQISVKQAA